MTQEERSKIILTILTREVSSTIKECGSVPSGHLYAHLMEVGVTYKMYTDIIDLLKFAGVVKEENFLLTWIGGADFQDEAQPNVPADAADTGGTAGSLPTPTTTTMLYQ